MSACLGVRCTLLSTKLWITQQQQQQQQ